MDDVILGHLLEQSMIRGDHLFISKHSNHSTTPCQDVSYAQWHRNGIAMAMALQGAEGRAV
jgi:hypothetical protein